MEDEGPIWTHLGDQGSFGDEGTFQECQKSSILTENWRRGVYFDAECLSAPYMFLIPFFDRCFCRVHSGRLGSGHEGETRITKMKLSENPCRQTEFVRQMPVGRGVCFGRSHMKKLFLLTPSGD